MVADRPELGGRSLTEVDPDRLMGWCRTIAAVIAVPRLNRDPHDKQTRFLLRLAISEG